MDFDDTPHERPFFPTFASWVEAANREGLGFSGLNDRVYAALAELSTDHLALLTSELRAIVALASDELTRRQRKEASA